MSVQANTTEATFGRIGPDDALTAIRPENRRASVTMSSSDEIATAYQLADALRLDPTTGRTFVSDAAGNEKAGLSAAEFIAQLQAGATSATRAKPSPGPGVGRSQPHHPRHRSERDRPLIPNDGQGSPGRRPRPRIRKSVG